MIYIFLLYRAYIIYHTPFCLFPHPSAKNQFSMRFSCKLHQYSQSKSTIISLMRFGAYQMFLDLLLPLSIISLMRFRTYQMFLDLLLSLSIISLMRFGTYQMFLDLLLPRYPPGKIGGSESSFEY